MTESKKQQYIRILAQYENSCQLGHVVHMEYSCNIGKKFAGRTTSNKDVFNANIKNRSMTRALAILANL